MKYEHGCFDWDYIEKRSSRQLRAIMTEKRVVPLSQNPSVAGVSKLLKLVRLNSDEIKEAFTKLRRDIKYALEAGFKRDLRRNNLPDLPLAPVHCANIGQNVIDVEYPKNYGFGAPLPDNNLDGSGPRTLLRGIWKVDEDWVSSIANNQSFPSAVVSVLDTNNNNYEKEAYLFGNASGDEIDNVLKGDYASFSNDSDTDVMSLDKNELHLMTKEHKIL